MPVPNSEIARNFDEYADLLEIHGANEYRVRAYRNAARNISYLSQDLAIMVRQGEDLTKLPGIADDLAGKIKEIIRTGHLSALEELKKTIPEGLIDITHIVGLGPKRAFRLYYDLGITSVEELEKAAREGKVKELSGFGIKTEQSILADIERRGEMRNGKRILLSSAEGIVQPLLAYLWESSGVSQVEVAGSYRRGVETVGDLDILVTFDKNSDVMDRFVAYDGVENVISKGPTRATILLRHGFQIDLRAVPEESYGAALHYFTGSKPHSIAIRKMGMRRRLKINEYGVFKGDKLIAGKTEEEGYEQVGLPYIEPELRENQGEIEAAKGGNLPDLITLENIRGDLHIHTNLSDGRSSLEQMAYAAQEKGYEYLAVTEHSKRLSVAHGINQARLAERIKEIDNLNRKLKNIILLKSIEVDILEDGSLDLSKEILEKLDLVICSVHHKFNLSREKQTERIIRAMQHPYFIILAHPSGRLINEREPYDVDMERLIRAARETGCVLELNAQPDRLDLEDIYCKMARDMGVMVAISSDAHSVDELNFMRYGVIQGRRGWLEPGNVLNSRRWPELKMMLNRSRTGTGLTKASTNVPERLTAAR
jgi:DNA polymerase (family X)